MRAKTKQLRFCLAAVTASGALVGLTIGCGTELPEAPVDGGADPTTDVVSPPTWPESATLDASTPDACTIDADAPDADTPDAPPPPPPPTYSIGGTITGLEGSGLVLHNGSETVDVDAGGTTFTFPTHVLAGTEFSVVVDTQPSTPTQECSVSGGTGTVISDDVATVTVNCTTSAFTVGGTVQGLAGSGLVLGFATTTGDAGADEVDLPISAVGSFAFPARLSGSTYAVHVETQPSYPLQDCVVENGEGSLAGADVTNVIVTCTTKTFALGGTITGLAGTLVLTNNGGSDKIISADGTFTFDAPVASGTSYDVQVKSQPTAPHQKCLVGNGTGNVTDAAVGSITVACKDIAYVDVVHGSDLATGGPSDPWKTLTHAIAATRAAPVDIFVAPGTYNKAAGETFPIRPRSHQNIVGDIAHKGAGPTPTLISGAGSVTYTGGDAVGTWPHGVYFGVGVTGASLRGIEVRVPTGNNIGFETSSATVEAVTLKGSDDVGFVVAHGANVSVVDSDFQDGIWGVVVVDAASKLSMRRTKVWKPTESAVVLGYLTPFIGSNVDLGTEADPGHNELLGGPGGLGLWLNKSSSGSSVTAIGNTWKHGVQGADAGGKYPSSFIDGSVAVPYVGGRNYSITTPSAGSGIHF